MKYLITLLFFISFVNVHSQTIKSDSVKKIPYDHNRILNPTELSLQSDIFSYDSLYIWSDKRTLSEIMDQRPGFFINNFGLGGRNNLNYNGNSYYQTGVFRDGIQVNDNYYQGFDIQNFSISEIDKVEEISAVSSFFYGINSSSKSLNVITKDIFNPQPFSQFRYSQDRDGSLYADVFLTLPVSRKGNVMIGLTKHSLDGLYANSAFDVWRGRARVNLFLSPKVNLRLDFNMSNFDRGLNEGLNYSPVKDSLQNPMEAMVVDPNQTENLENYFYSAQLTAKLFKNQDWLTKIKLYSVNSLRTLYNDRDTSFVNNYKLDSGYQHSILYGTELLQNITLNSGRHFNSDLTFGGNIYGNLFNGNFNNGIDNYFRNNSQYLYFSLKAKYYLNYKIFSATTLIRNDNFSEYGFLNYGAEGSIKAFDKNNFLLNFNGGYRRTEYELFNAAKPKLLSFEEPPVSYTVNNFYNAGLSFGYKQSELYFEYSSGKNQYANNTVQNINAGINLISEYFDVMVNYNNSNDLLVPENYIKSDLAFKDILFRGKLKLRTGFNFKYYNIRYITDQYQSVYSYGVTNNTFPQQNQYMVDFYVGARIGRANINITVANILNTLVYNAYLFPLDDRGGLFNAISRFTIVWDFIN